MGCWKADRQQPLGRARATAVQQEAGKRKLIGFFAVCMPVKSVSYPRGISGSFLRGISGSFGLPHLIEIFFNLSSVEKSPVVGGDPLWKTQH